jgi:Flp pilus assembly pilin Flp
VTVLARTAKLAGATFASASYTATSFIASFVSVAIIAGGLPTAERAALFLFLALYSPLATVMSQRKLLSIYQNRVSGSGATAIEETVLFVATAAIVMAATWHYYGPLEAVVLASTVFCQIHSATAAGAIQHRSGNALGWSIAVLAAAAVRIGATWLGLDYGPVIAFAAGSYAFLLAMVTLQALTRRKAGKLPVEPDGAATADAAPEAWYERMVTFVFFSVAAVTFQIDKYALDGAGRTAEVAESGALTMLLLSPISLLFATLYRTRTRSLFSGDLPLHAKMPVVGTIAAQFVAGVVLYLAIVLAPWPGVVGLAFPFVQAPTAAFLVFALAIVADRLGTLLVFATGGWRAYLACATFKVAALALVYAGIRFWMGSQTLTVVYLAYLAAALAYLLLVALLMMWFKGRHAQV